MLLQFCMNNWKKTSSVGYCLKEVHSNLAYKNILLSYRKKLAYAHTMFVFPFLLLE